MTEAPASAAVEVLEIRIAGGIYALNRFLMTLQGKRMPVKSLRVRMDGGDIRAGLIFDCPPEASRRYATLLAGLHDVQEVRSFQKTLEVALLGNAGGDWRGAAARAGVEAHEDGDAVLASGEPERLETWLTALGEDVDAIRLGPVARPERGGD